MMAAIKSDQFAGFEHIRGELSFDEPMSKHTSWRVGGNADVYFVPASIDDLAQFLLALPGEMDIVMTGLGSNLLVRDGGLRAAVVCTHKGLAEIEIRDEHRVYAEAGVPGAKVARQSLKNGLRGAEFLAGIPGTVGGALAMNAGAFGGETWNIVSSVHTVDRQGELRTRVPAEFRIGYRQVSGPADEYFVAADFTLAPGDTDTGRGEIRDLLAKRGSSQPVQSANAGSVFANPENDFAARLIEVSGLKGLAHGGARISEQHANFIINEDEASAADIEYLIEHARRVVLETHGIELEPEVRIVGEVGHGS